MDDTPPDEQFDCTPSPSSDYASGMSAEHKIIYDAASTDTRMEREIKLLRMMTELMAAKSTINRTGIVQQITLLCRVIAMHTAQKESEVLAAELASAADEVLELKQAQLALPLDEAETLHGAPGGTDRHPLAQA